MAIRGVLLDKDGTLIDCDRSWGPVIRRLACELAADRDADLLLDQAGLDLRTGRFRAGSVWGAGSTRDLVALWWPEADERAAAGLAARIDAVCAEMGPRCAVPLYDLDRLFRDLAHRDLVAGVATNDSSASLSAFLAARGLTGHLAHRYGYDSVKRAKPAPDMVLAFASDCALAAAEIAVVGDNTHDLEMARAGGAVAVAVLSGNGGRADLEPLADIILDGVGDLVAWLDNHQPAKVSKHVL